MLGGFAPPPPPPPPGTAVLALSTPPGATFMGSGTDGGGATTLARTQAQAQVFNTGSWTPSFFCSAGWGMMAVSPFSSTNVAGGSGVYPVSWSAQGGSGVSVRVMGGDGASGGVDLYLWPAAGLRQHVMAQADLQGHAALPPRFFFGFIACRWGWADQQYIEGVLSEFRSGSFPADAFVSDFEWYTSMPDYSLPSSGAPDFHDFLFNNITFPDPAASYVAKYRNQYNFRFGGIRKPRLGNSALLVQAQQNGWLMGQGGEPSGTPNGSRNTNYSDPTFFNWYASQNNLFLQSGVRFFWNDEGEADYFTFTDWSRSQIAGQAAFNATSRYVSINRAFSPGAAKLGAVVWTGDISPQWQDLQRTPGYVLNWGLAGAPYVTCDTGGFSGETNALLLARWYATSAFIPVMRVHSTNSATPHFPFPELWGQEASDAMKAMLQLRYALLPYTYSLGHEAFATGLPLARQMAIEFPLDPAVVSLTAQWMFGPALLVAPVLTPDNATSAYLPLGTSWFEWGTTTMHPGGSTESLSSVPLDAVPVYVRAGSVLPLAPPLQFTDALPGGPLQVAVYGGADGAFTMVEDDGETFSYQAGGAATLELAWDDTTGCLSWARGGVAGSGGAQAFAQLAVTAYLSSGATATAAATPITATGTVCPK